ncbi:MAG: PEGA domain-containing protein [Myxococcaceae bacterium]|nr:PEGA domain-containing protein [Myxococcaceae bacterium]
MNPLRLLPFLVVSSLSVGCATVSASTTVPYRVDSSPQGAEILVDGQSVGWTPATITLPRKASSTVQLKSPGFEAHTCRTAMTPAGGYVAADTLMCLFLFPLGCVAFVDAGGAWNDLQESSCQATLVPEGAPSWNRRPAFSSVTEVSSPNQPVALAPAPPSRGPPAPPPAPAYVSASRPPPLAAKQGCTAAQLMTLVRSGLSSEQILAACPNG